MAMSATTKKAGDTHYFVIGPQGLSIHLKGPFESREAAAKFIQVNRSHAPCWLVPAEYVGLVDHTPLGPEGVKLT